MVQITDKTKCCGCTACYSICPEKCITMVSDCEGFLYPVADQNTCINCHACEKVCPFHHLTGEEKSETIYAAVQYKDENKRYTSTAGGAFSFIADYFLDNYGVVYAVGYDHMIVCHKKCTDKNMMQEFRGSKYVQSTLNDTFGEILALLEAGQKILFVGTPCQVHGLKNLTRDNENLWTIDLLCLGVSSPALFHEWIEYLNNKYKCCVSNVQFRNKHYGYATPNVRVFFDNGKEMDQKYDTRVHANLFFRHYNVRPSCYECEFRTIPRVSDFTLGDFTEIGAIDKNLDDDKGTTKLWIHTPKGKALFERIKDNAKIHPLCGESTNVIGGPKKQIKRPEKRSQFFDDVQTLDYFSLVSKWEPKNFKGEFAGIMRPIINMLPFKTMLFQYLRQRKMKNYHRNVESLNLEKE